MHVAAIGLEVDDRVTHQLPGSVIRDVAAASGLEDLDSGGFQFTVAGNDVRPVVA